MATIFLVPVLSSNAAEVRRRLVTVSFVLRDQSIGVADFTYTSTWTGFAYVVVVIDAYSRRILRSRAARSMTAVLR